MTKNKILSVLTVAGMLSIGFLGALQASADITPGSQIDSSSNFTIIDTNTPIASNGNITSFSYYASNTNPFEFVVVDSANMVKWVSPMITPTTPTAINTYTPTSPIPVQTGWKVGLYFSSTGTIPFNSSGATASWTAPGSGAPTIGSTLTVAGSGARTYSFVANFSAIATPVLTSLAVSPASATLGIGAVQQLTVSPMDQNNTAFPGVTLSYVSANPAIATVSASGLVTGVSAGSTTITATGTSGAIHVSGTFAVTVGSSGTSGVIGNNTNAENQIDSFSNFTVVDVNHPATQNGQISSISYYASNLNPFDFVIVNGSNVVQWVSPMVTPTTIGVNTYILPTPIAVQTGWNIGLYFSLTGTIPYSGTGASASWTATGSGVPSFGMTLSFVGSGARTYSFVANESATTATPVLTSVTLTPASETLNIGATQQLTSNPMDQNSAMFPGTTISYVSSDPSIATVSSSGLITAVSAGSATITVTSTSGATSVSATSEVMVISGDDNGNGNGGNDNARRLRIRIILQMIRRLLNQLGITQTFTANGMTF